jgi:hypothetical protein
VNRIKIYLAISFLLLAALACNISSPQGPSVAEPEVVTVISTATVEQPAEAQAESQTSDQVSPTSESPPEEGNSSVEEGTTISPDGAIRSSVSIKDGEASFEGSISFPGDHTSDDISVKPTGFDSAESTGYLVFNLSCSGRGNAKVNYKGGRVESGTPACGETWKIYVINGSPDAHVNIRLDASGEINWALTVAASQ